jgi:hypothetical protein
MKVDDWMRVSSLYRICAREEVICSLHNKKRTDIIEPGLMMIFNHGHGLHYALQNIVLPDIGVLKGQWICLKCGHKHGGYPKDGGHIETSVVFRPDECAHCGNSNSTPQDAFFFNELRFADEDILLQGHNDGFLQVDGREGLGVLEAKSIGDRPSWEVRQTPRIDHVIQAQAYMMLTDTQWAIILYWNKGGYGDNMIIEHFVERDEDTILGIRQMIRSIRVGIRDREYPERICETGKCPRAKECPVGELCFDEARLEKINAA